MTRFGHGMTVGTNALLEGTGARTALVATEGFGDVLELRRQTRAHLYRLDAHHPPPLVPHERTHEVSERCGPDGVLTPLDPASVERAVAAVRADGAEAVAVGLLFSFAHPAHEAAVAAALRAALPGVHVSASSEVLPEIREYERISTTAVDAYLTPVLRAYLERLGRAGRGGGAARPRDHAVERRGAADRRVGRARRLDRPERPGGRGDRGRPAGRPRAAAAGAHLRHGRHVVRRRPGPRRRARAHERRR